MENYPDKTIETIIAFIVTFFLVFFSILSEPDGSKQGYITAFIFSGLTTIAIYILWNSALSHQED